jgi:hypothetical protein
MPLKEFNGLPTPLKAFKGLAMEGLARLLRCL